MKRLQRVRPRRSEAVPGIEARAIPGAAAEATPTALIYRRKAKRRKRRFTLGTTHLQGLVDSDAKILWRLSDAAADGVRTYNRAARRSARRRKDGAFRDAPVNLARGFRRAGREAAKAPYDLVSRLDVRFLWRADLPILGSLGRSLGMR